MIYVTRKAHFSSSHRLFNPDFSDEKNDAVFDKCNNVHGHNYTLEVTVAGVPDPETGYVIDLKLLKHILDEEVLDKMDHRHLNDVDLLKGLIPTAEHLALVIWNVIEPKIPHGKLYSVKVFESDNNFVEYFGEPVTIRRFHRAFAEDKA